MKLYTKARGQNEIYIAIVCRETIMYSRCIHIERWSRKMQEKVKIEFTKNKIK